MKSPLTLVTFATKAFRIRQRLLDRIARRRGVVDRSRLWGVRDLERAGFKEVCTEVSLDERGAGFWVWKPFIIAETLRELDDGDLLLYCDVGRLYPWKLLDRPLDRLVAWMDAKAQHVFPGILIPWQGPMSRWTKREVFVATGTDTPDVHASCPVQASFSIWRKNEQILALAEEWLALCKQRSLVSDDPSNCDLPELPDFKEHRHDQCLWSILCLKYGLEAFDAGMETPSYDEKNPAEIARVLGEPGQPFPVWTRAFIALASALEKRLR